MSKVNLGAGAAPNLQNAFSAARGDIEEGGAGLSADDAKREVKRVQKKISKRMRGGGMVKKTGVRKMRGGGMAKKRKK